MQLIMKYFYCSGLLLLLISCNNSSNDPSNVSSTESEGTMVISQKEEKKPTWRREIEDESDQLENKLNTLEKQIDTISGKAKAETQAAIEKLRRKKDEVLSDTTNSNVKKEWEGLKKSVKDFSDSLNNKF